MFLGDRNAARGVSSVLAVVFLVAIAVIAGAVVAGHAFGVVDGVLGTDAPQAVYEFDYDEGSGLVRVTQVSGDSFAGADLDSLYVTVTSGGTTEEFSWASAVDPDDRVSSGSSVSLDDASGSDVGSFTFPGTFGPDSTVRVVYEGRSESYTLASYVVPAGSRTYVRWAVPRTGLDAHYALDESDPVVADAAGSADGSVRGDPALGVGGQVGTAFEFDGDGDYVALDRSYSGAGSVDGLTACAWFRTDETGTGEFDNWALLDFDRSEYFNLYVRGDTGGVGFSTSGETATMVDHSTSTDYADGDWHLACGTYDADTDRKRIYVDGTLEVDAAATNPDGLGTGTERWGFIGDGSEAGALDGGRNDKHYTGRIDEVRLYDTALSENEVEALHDAGRGSGSAPTGGLVNHWSLDETGSPSATVADAAGSGDGIVVGSNTDRGVPGRVGTAYRFEDGSGYVALDRSLESDDVGNVTVCAWFRTSETGGGSNWALLDFDRSEYFNLYVQGDGAVGWSTSSDPGGAGIDDLYTGPSYNDGNWHHACGVYDGDKRIVVDGSAVSARTVPHGGSGLGSGARRYGFVGDGSEAESFDGDRNGIYYDGTVDDVRLYGRALSTAEAARLWAFGGGAVAGHETVARQFADPVDLSNLRLENVDVRLPSGTGVEIRVEADTDGDGSFDATSDPVTLDGSGSHDVTGLSGSAERVRLRVAFAASGDATPTLEGIDLAVG